METVAEYNERKIQGRADRRVVQEEARTPLIYNSYMRDIWKDGKVAQFLIGRNSNRQRLMVSIQGALPLEPIPLEVIHRGENFLGNIFGQATGGRFKKEISFALQEGDFLEVCLSVDHSLLLEVTTCLECW